MRYVLLFIFYFIGVIITYKRLNPKKDIGVIILAAIAIHLCIACLVLTIFLFYYFW